MSTRHASALASLGLTLLTACSSSGSVPGQLSSEELTQQTATWRAERMARLVREDGWLTLVGLLWLREGNNRFGSGADNELSLQHASLPAQAGVFRLDQGTITFTATADAPFTSPQQPVMSAGTPLVMQPDSRGEATQLALDSLNIQVIERGGRYALRVRDSQSAARRNFAGIKSFAVSTTWRKSARYEPYTPVKQVPIVNVLGMTENMTAPGALVFEHDGKTYRLDALIESPEASELFVMFADATSGRESYGAGRYLYVPRPTAGESQVWLDFNRAYNPPCAFTEYATCPLPPRQNRLSLAITAGEKKYAAH